jgi:hypothetical protein
MMCSIILLDANTLLRLGIIIANIDKELVDHHLVGRKLALLNL